ncbi:MAG: GNAT family N-acetyltransferase [Planctomycetes bacterium]|nr:GNAT family N-acetyltransferase [Planctomycetota bacterium]
MEAPELRSTVATLPQLTPTDLLDALELRARVFVVEQNCVYLDPGDEDRHPQTRHVLLRTPAGALVAYARLIPPGLEGPEPLIGRVVCDPNWRGKGVGHWLMGVSREHIASLWPGLAIRLHAQTYLQSFYVGHGFEPSGEVYLLDGIEHIEMVRPVH